MLETLKKSIVPVLFVAASLSALALFAPTVGATDPQVEARKGFQAAGGAGQDLGGGIQTIVNILLFVLGAIAVIAIVIGGIRYATSNGDSSQITSAKNTILYAVVGLIVALLAYAIVNFVLNQFI